MRTIYGSISWYLLQFCYKLTPFWMNSPRCNPLRSNARGTITTHNGNHAATMDAYIYIDFNANRIDTFVTSSRRVNSYWNLGLSMVLNSHGILQFIWGNCFPVVLRYISGLCLEHVLNIYQTHAKYVCRLETWCVWILLTYWQNQVSRYIEYHIHMNVYAHDISLIHVKLNALNQSFFKCLFLDSRWSIWCKCDVVIPWKCVTRRYVLQKFQEIGSWFPVYSY